MTETMTSSLLKQRAKSAHVHLPRKSGVRAVYGDLRDARAARAERLRRRKHGRVLDR